MVTCNTSAKGWRGQSNSQSDVRVRPCTSHASARKFLPLCMLGLFLAGCASTHSRDFAYQAASMSLPRPTGLVIAVSQREGGAPGEAPPLSLEQRRQIALALKQALTKRMRWTSGEIEILDMTNGPPFGRNTLVLNCTVTQIKPGNQALRLAVGFGVGKATLGISTQLVDMRGPTPVYLARFTTQSTTGAMPSAVLGLAGAASGGALGIAGGSAGLLLGARETLNREINQSSGQIASQIQGYFKDKGWLESAAAS